MRRPALPPYCQRHAPVLARLHGHSPEPSATLGSARLGWRARLHGVGHLAQLAAPRGSHSAKLQDLVPGLRANASVLALPVP